MTLSAGQSVASVHTAAGPSSFSGCCHPASCWWGCRLSVLSEKSPVNRPATELCSKKLWVEPVGFCSLISVSWCLTPKLTNWKRTIFTLKPLLNRGMKVNPLCSLGLSEAQMDTLHALLSCSCRARSCNTCQFIWSSPHLHWAGQILPSYFYCWASQMLGELTNCATHTVKAEPRRAGSRLQSAAPLHLLVYAIADSAPMFQTACFGFQGLHSHFKTREM